MVTLVTVINNCTIFLSRDWDYSRDTDRDEIRAGTRLGTSTGDGIRAGTGTGNGTRIEARTGDGMRAGTRTMDGTRTWEDYGWK